MKPVLKWAGGKRQLMDALMSFINKDTIGNGRYFEPFFGGGSLFFNLEVNNAVINDFNKEIVNVYNVIKNDPETLIKLLHKHEAKNNPDYFYEIRAKDRSKVFSNPHIYSDTYKASRTIYLNKTCFNGLYRVNSKGFFNVPFASYVHPLICDEKNIREISKFLNESNTQILNGDFEDAVKEAKCGDFIYFDPPYDYENKKGFVGYVKEGFSHDDLLRLKRVCDDLINRGCKVLISNNDTAFVRKTFKGDNFKVVYETKKLKANRSINCKGNKRKNAEEVLIYGRRKED